MKVFFKNRNWSYTKIGKEKFNVIPSGFENSESFPFYGSSRDLKEAFEDAVNQEEELIDIGEK